MNIPTPTPRPPAPRADPDDPRVRLWLALRHELAELHARLEYLKLMASLGVRE